MKPVFRLLFLLLVLLTGGSAYAQDTVGTDSIPPLFTDAMYDTMDYGEFMEMEVANTKFDLNSLDSIVVCVAREDLAEALEALNSVRDRVGAEEVAHEREVAMVSIFGPHFGQRPGIAGVIAEASGSFSSSYLVSAGLTALAIMMTLLLPRPVDC